jgi:hypothetical protein
VARLPSSANLFCYKRKTGIDPTRLTVHSAAWRYSDATSNGGLSDMPNVDWTDPGSSDNWSVTTNWAGLVGEAYPGQFAAAGDIVTIGASNSAYVVTFDVPSATISSLTIEGGNGTPHDTILQMTADNTLIIQGGVTLFKKDSNAAIDGAGTISVGGGITAAGATASEGFITAGTDTTGGVLDLTLTGCGTEGGQGQPDGGAS